MLLDLRFPSVVYKKLQDGSVSLEDLEDVFPAQGASFGEMLAWPASDEAGFEAAFGELTFEVEWDCFGELKTQELVPGGKTIKLTHANRREYVAAYVKYLLVTSVAPQFQAFKQGFLHFQTLLVRTLAPAELELLVCGSRSLDFAEMRQGAQYEGFDPASEYIDGFWEILGGFSEEQKKKFLRFCTGTDRVPVGGLRELRLKVQKNGAEPTDKLPTAYTCFNLLLLPLYADVEKMRDRLVTAIENFEGFGLR